MNILIAPNAFKNSLSAEEVASAIKEGLEKSKLDCICECFPIADGGDGTGFLLIKRMGGIKIATEVHDSLGRPITTSIGLIDNGKTAVIEMADASGIRLLKQDELNPLRATSFGTGEQIKQALDNNVNKIIICMGGSATVDGGTGILTALGVRFLNVDGHTLDNLPESLTNLASIDLSGLDKRILDCEIIVLCDVDNQLLGEKGAVAVFGPQKGAGPAEIILLEKALTKFAEITLLTTGIDISTIKKGGTAGGAASGLYAFLHTSLVNGIDYFLELTGFDEKLKTSDIIITGEGSIDEQTLEGKAPFGVAKRAKILHIPVIALAGKVPLAANASLSEYFDVLLAIGNQPAELESALIYTKDNLVRVSQQIGNLIALAQN